MSYISNIEDIKKCPTEFALALRDTLNVLSGKWKLNVIGVLFFGKKRFTEIEKGLEEITPRMLSKELKELELNGVVNRIVTASRPVVIEYELTESGYELKKVLDEMIGWGILHREKYSRSEIIDHAAFCFAFCFLKWF